MAWETALDRFVIQQIHLAERGEARTEDVREAIRVLHGLASGRPETAFHLGYARALLGVDFPEPQPQDQAARRFYAFGRLRGHERRGERNWVADLLTDPAMITELLGDPRIASQCLPVAMRTLFWSGELDLAVQAIDYLSTASTDAEERDVLVDAAMADLLTRLERRDDPDQAESTLSVLHKCVGLACFEQLPEDVRAGYQHELGRRLLAISEFDEALPLFEAALPMAGDARLLRGRCALGGALATLRVHDATELAPQAERESRDEARAWLARAGESSDCRAPEALFVEGLLAYETGDYGQAMQLLEQAGKRLRRVAERDAPLLARTSFFLAASILAGGITEETARALRAMEESLDRVQPDLESFYSVHEALKEKDRRLALRFLDAVDVGRGTAPDQLLIVALEYLALGEARPAQQAAERVLAVAVDLDQRVEAMRVLLTAHNMRGDRTSARAVYQDIRELLMQRGKFADLEKLLLNEEFVGQALDHLEIRCELVSVYEEMEERDFEKAQLQATIARTLRARKDEASLREALAMLREVEIAFPDLVHEDIVAIGKLLELADAEPTDADSAEGRCATITEALGRQPRVMVVGGNERQRRHHPKFEALAEDWGFDGEWLMANYSSPQKLVQTIGDRIQDGVDVLVLLHWNRHETTEPAHELARRAGVQARVLHYAGFTSLQMCLEEMLGRVAEAATLEPAAKSGRRAKSRS